MSSSIICEFYSDDLNKKAIVTGASPIYYIDFYHYDNFVCSKAYIQNLQYVENIADDYVRGIIELKEFMHVNRKSNIQ
jgi:hypothetical protein